MGDEHSKTRGPVAEDDDRRRETRNDEKRPYYEGETSDCMQSDQGGSIRVNGCVPRTASMVMNAIAAETSARNTMEERMNRVRPLQKGP